MCIHTCNRLLNKITTMRHRTFLKEEVKIKGEQKEKEGEHNCGL